MTPVSGKGNFLVGLDGFWVSDVVIHGWVSTAEFPTGAGQWSVVAMYAGLRLSVETTSARPLTRMVVVLFFLSRPSSEPWYGAVRGGLIVSRQRNMHTMW